MLSESESRVASPLQCFNMEVTKYREINARLLEEITENRSKLGVAPTVLTATMLLPSVATGSRRACPWRSPKGLM